MPAFVRSPRVLPVIKTQDELRSFLVNWKGAIRQTLRTPSPPACPFNFKGVPSAGSISLSWAKVQYAANGQTSDIGPDGYEILRSASGDFTDTVVIPIRDINQTSYVDAITGTPSYRIHTTSGTSSKPHSVTGPDSGVIRVTTGSGVTKKDEFTSDQNRAVASRGRYRDLL